MTAFPKCLKIKADALDEFAACEEAAHEDGEQAKEYGISAFDVLTRHKTQIEIRNERELELIDYAARYSTFDLYFPRVARRVSDWCKDPDAFGARRVKQPATFPASQTVETYNDINAAWAGLTIPPITRHEADRAVRALYRKFGKSDLGGPEQQSDMTFGGNVRRCWISRAQNGALERGWGRLVHDVSHFVFRRRHPKWRPHHPQHAILEREMADHVRACGWLDGLLRAAEPAKMTPDQRTAERRAALDARLAAWQTKQKRATNAIKKVRRQIAAMERRVRRATTTTTEGAS